MALTIVALIAIVASGWGLVDYIIRVWDEISCGRWHRQHRIPDAIIMAACASCVISAGHSIACLWFL